jgi:hypothetical protein
VKRLALLIAVSPGPRPPVLDAALALNDPVWRGMYQYSDEANWRSPRSVGRYLAEHLSSPDGAFYISQDPT